MSIPKPLAKKRADDGEVVGGGFVIFRRGRNSKRIHSSRFDTPFEYPSFDTAEREMKRLSIENPHVEFCVFYQVTSLKAA